MLGDDDRARFAQRLLEHVLDVLAACELDGVLVATGGDDVAALAASRGAHVLRDRGEGSLADVVDRALAEVASRGAAAAVVLMADLPRIERARRRARSSRPSTSTTSPSCAITSVTTPTRSPSRRPTAIATCFGRDDSFAAHCAAARAAGLRVAVVESERIAFDVDVPADHQELTARATGSRNLKRSSRVSRS